MSSGLITSKGQKILMKKKKKNSNDFEYYLNHFNFQIFSRVSEQGNKNIQYATQD